LKGLRTGVETTTILLIPLAPNPKSKLERPGLPLVHCMRGAPWNIWANSAANYSVPELLKWSSLTG